MKYEWKKEEKEIYLAKAKSSVITVPVFKFYSVNGKGNPNDTEFSECVGALYSLSYAIRMSHKAGYAPADFYEFTVYPLEGVWDITEEAKKNYTGVLDKNALVFNLMIRQPDFVTAEFANEVMERTKKRKPNPFLDKVQFTELEEGKCVQMMHLDSYDNESETFEIMEKYCQENSLKRLSRRHKEIYISDPRKVRPDKLKTVLRFKVEKI
ncbi:MAG: GyrI-like domain-containing protein [Desulfobacteraceae bacterium]|jgi:hypothetical protein